MISWHLSCFYFSLKVERTKFETADFILIYARYLQKYEIAAVIPRQATT